MELRVPQHEHPLHLRDLLKEYEEYEDEHEEEIEDEDIIIPQDFLRTCALCGEEIKWLHRYFYECSHSCDFSLHRFCAELPVTLNHKCHSAHTLTLFPNTKERWKCDICWAYYSEEKSGYGCLKCNIFIDIRCAMATTEYQIIYHQSHPHPLVPLSKQISPRCDACGEEHENLGTFYMCTTCFGVFIHGDCVFLPNKLFIQEITNNNFSHVHPLTLSYSFPPAEWSEKRYPRCRVCDRFFSYQRFWVLKCEKCWYYTHLSCATSGGDSSSYFGKNIIKNFEDSDYPDLLHLPFPTVSDNILKHLFSNRVGCEKIKMEDENKVLEHSSHQHPLILLRRESESSNDTPPCHDPMKNIELLCNGCVKPITSMPFYKCADKCNFVLHEWCTRLPDQLQNYFGHKQHPLVLQPYVSNRFFSIFDCAVCSLPCNGFVYSCVKCDYHIDVTCAFIPEKITHEAHPGHLMSRVETESWMGRCCVCRLFYDIYGKKFSFRCQPCGVHVHASCAMLLPREIRHKNDKHPMSISYNPIENHKSEYFCEICEKELDPDLCFYHCYQCAQSVHTYCAPQILQSERASHRERPYRAVYKFVNIKFGGMLDNSKYHSHLLIFDQGIESDGRCNECDGILNYEMIFKCQQCTYAIHLNCCKGMFGWEKWRWRNENDFIFLDWLGKMAGRRIDFIS